MPDSPLGRPRKLTERQARLIVRQATPNLFTAVQLRNLYAPSVSVRTVQRLLQNATHLGWRKMKAAPKLTPKHRSARISWARNFLSTTPYVRRHTVYSDEKRFNLDRPDGFQYYWADLRKEDDPISRHQNGGGGIMIWGCISTVGKLHITITTEILNAESYVFMLEECFKPWRSRHHPNYCHFQQDGARPHTAKVTLDYLFGEGLDVMRWPAR